MLEAVLGSAELLVPEEGSTCASAACHVLGSCELPPRRRGAAVGAPIVRVIVAGRARLGRGPQRGAPDRPPQGRGEEARRALDHGAVPDAPRCAEAARARRADAARRATALTRPWSPRRRAADRVEELVAADSERPVGPAKRQRRGRASRRGSASVPTASRASPAGRRGRARRCGTCSATIRAGPSLHEVQPGWQRRPGTTAPIAAIVPPAPLRPSGAHPHRDDRREDGARGIDRVEHEVRPSLAW